MISDNYTRNSSSYNQGYNKPQKSFQKPAFKKPISAKKKEPVKITQTSLVQDMFLDSMKNQEKEVIIHTNSGKEHKGVIIHFDRYIIVLGPKSSPKVIYKSSIESLHIDGTLAIE